MIGQTEASEAAASDQMSPPTPPAFCPFIGRLIALLAEDGPAFWARQDALLFGRLLDLEMDAEKQGAPEASLRIIGRVRRITGEAAIKGNSPTIRGH